MNTHAIETTLRRSRITERLAAPCRVALMFAPAGCGKSTALTQFVGSLHGEWLRFDLRADNAELLGFARGLAESARAVSPGARLSVAEAVRSAVSSQAPGEFLADWMEAHLAGYRGTIVLDDVHRAAGDPASASFLSALVSRTQSRVRWVIAGRGIGLLPIDEWIESGIAEAVAGERELRFTSEEARSAAAYLSAHLPESDVDAFVSTTSGWAAALFLALQLHRYQPALPASAAMARQFSYDYLADEIYHMLDGTERSLLEFASLLPEVDAAVLDAAGFEDADARLDALARRLSFLTPLPGASGGDVRPRYRCHDLFREFLGHRVDLLETTSRAAMKRHAAASLEACGHNVAALRLYSESEAVEDALRLLQRDGFDFVARGHEDTIEFALQKLPRDCAEHSAVLAIRGRQAYHNAQTDQAVALLERAIAASNDDAHTGKLRFWQGVAMMAHYKDPIAVLEPVAANETLAPELQADLNCVLLGAYLQRDLSSDVDALFDKISWLCERVPSPIDRSRILSSLGRFRSWRGEASAKDLLLKAADLAQSVSAHREEAKAYESLAGNSVSAGRFEEALQFADLGAAAAEKCGASVHIISALCHRVTALYNAGRQDELDATLARMEALSPSDLAPVYAVAIRSGRAMSAAWSGDFATAHEAAAKTCTTTKFWEARMIATARCAVYYAADGHGDEAVAFATRAIEESRASDWTRSACGRYYEISLALCALAYALCGDRATMRRLLRRKLRHATPAGAALKAAVKAIGEWRGAAPPPDLREPLAALERGWFGGYAKLLEAVVRERLTKSVNDAPLLPAERAVLQRLAAGITPKEIAFERGSSLQTVRWHIKRIVKKLECTGYFDAVRAAREKGWL